MKRLLCRNEQTGCTGCFCGNSREKRTPPYQAGPPHPPCADAAARHRAARRLLCRANTPKEEVVYVNLNRGDRFREGRHVGQYLQLGSRTVQIVDYGATTRPFATSTSSDGISVENDTIHHRH
jgi:hypothetical protein